MYLQIVHPSKIYEVDGGTGLGKTQEITKMGGTKCKKLNKRKLCGKLKGRIFADGKQQRLYIPK